MQKLKASTTREIVIYKDLRDSAGFQTVYMHREIFA